MDLANLLMLAVGLTLGLSLIVAIRSGVGKPPARTLVQYFWGDKSLTPGDNAHLNLSTSLSLNGMLYQTWLGYAVGPAALWLQAAWCAGFIFMGLRSPQVKRLSEAGTLHGIIGRRFGGAAERFGAMATIAGYTMQVGWELAVFVSLFLLIVPSAGIGFQITTTLLIALIVAIYTIYGGLRGNLAANIFQNWLGVLSLCVALVLALKLSHVSVAIFVGSHSHAALLSTLGVAGLVTNFIFSTSWQLVDMSNWQNVSATAGGAGQTRSALFRSAFWVFVFPGVIGTVLGMAMRPVAGVTDSNIIAKLIELTSTGPAIGVFIIAGFVGIMLSTLDGLLLASAQALTWDILDSRAVARLLEMERGGMDGDLDIGTPQQEETRRILFKTRTLVMLVALIGAGAVFAIHAVAHLTLFDLVYVVVISQMVCSQLYPQSCLVGSQPGAHRSASWEVGSSEWR